MDDVTTTPLPRLAPRAPDSHKGDFGHAMVIGGSRGMSGAIALAGMAAVRSGAGLVTLGVPRSIQDVVAGFSPCLMTLGLAEQDGRIAAATLGELASFAQKATVVAVGPGIGRSSEVTQFVTQLYSDWPQPMVVDADALFALAEQPQCLTQPGGVRILTPHPGEFRRLAGSAAGLAKGKREALENFESDRPAAAAALAQLDATNRTVVVLKGHRTVISDGSRYSVNQTGNPGMATGGTGDVLTGVITALLCQGLSPFDAARLGVHIHGLAGDLAASDVGQVSLIATDLIECLHKSF